MARVGSGDSFDIGTWPQGENPGAGSQDFTVFTDTGLNGNFKRLWRAIKSLLNADGTVQNDKIDGQHIKNTLPDGATLETSAASGAKNLRIKDLGVSTAKIADSAVTNVKLATDAVTQDKMANNSVGTDELIDANVTLAKMAADSVDSSKITHDNTRTKQLFTLVFDGTGASPKFHGTAIASGQGIPMPRAGSITKILSCNSAGTVVNQAIAYATSGINHFNAHQKIRGTFTSPDLLEFQIDGVATGYALTAGSTYPYFVTIEVEFDD